MGAAESRTHTRYRRATEHLEDTLARLDLLLRRALIGRRRPAATDYLSFAAITEDEVLGLLRRSDVGDEPVPDLGLQEGEAAATDRALAATEMRLARRVTRTLHEGYRLPLVDLVERFSLSPLERDILLLAAAADVDWRYERIFGYLHDDMGRRLPSLGLALSVLTAGGEATVAARAVLGPQAPLRRFRLVEMVDDGGPSSGLAKALRVDERVLAFLVGDENPDARIADAVEVSMVSAGQDPSLRRLAADLEQLRSLVAGWAEVGPGRHKPIVYLYGIPGCGAEELASEVASELDLPVLRVDLAALFATMPDASDALLIVFREALLRQAALLLCGVEAPFDDDRGGIGRRALMRWAAELGGLVMIVGRSPWRWPLPEPPLVLRALALNPASLAEQLDTWRCLLGTGGQGEDRIDGRVLERLVSRHPMPVGSISNAWRIARDLASLRGGDGSVVIDDLEQACRAGASLPVSGLTRVIEPRHDWLDLVLPPAQMEQLRALCNQATHLATVYGTWGFERKLSLGKGLNALFSGPPGTGKTMAAEVIAAELDLPLLKIDLSQVVSKYIGETEKNLRALFDQAATAHAILLFDEADALLGKRSAVGDAHDRYANTEVAYLLQKMEEYEGITILATNLRQNMDEAFTRRMRFVVDFPFPEEADRLSIWRRIWPPEVPGVAGLDLARMAQQFRLCGGNIRNIALAAAFLAAAENRPVAMAHLLHATRRELQKMGRLVDEAEDRFRV